MGQVEKPPKTGYNFLPKSNTARPTKKRPKRRSHIGLPGSKQRGHPSWDAMVEWRSVVEVLFFAWNGNLRRDVRLVLRINGLFHPFISKL